MTRNTAEARGWRGDNAVIPLALAGVFLALYVANVLIGKLSVLHFTRIRGVGDVAECLLLFIAVICFVAGTLVLERRRDRLSQQKPDGGNDGQ